MQVSRATQQLDPVLEQWRERVLDRHGEPYGIVDYDQVRRAAGARERVDV